jgi:hypothetical protein
MADNTSFGRRGTTQAGMGMRAAQNSGRPMTPAANTLAPETSLERMLRLPWRWTAFGIMLCLLTVYLTQPEPLKDIAKWTALAVGASAGILNTRLAKEAVLKRAQEALRSIPRN